MSKNTNSGMLLRHVVSSRYRRSVSLSLLEKIFENPRVHTGIGYHTRDQMPGAGANLSSRELDHIEHAAAPSEVKGILAHLRQLAGDAAQNAADIDIYFGHLILQLGKDAGTLPPDLTQLLPEGQVLVQHAVFDAEHKIGYYADAVVGCQGVKVDRVIGGSAAQAAGLRAGDHIIAMTVPVTGWETIETTVRVKGVPFKLGLLRGGQPTYIIVERDHDGFLGIQQKGAEVSGPMSLESISGGNAERAGLQDGDIIVSITVPIAEGISVEDLAPRIPPHTSVALTLFREGLKEAGGMAAASSPSKECIVCLDRPKDTVFQCGHFTCSQCAISLKNCPTCRAVILHKIKTYE